MLEVEIRHEQEGEASAIGAVIESAFAGKSYSQQTEHRIVESLRSSGALSLSLVALHRGGIVGQIAFSPLTINGKISTWLGLGPVAVMPKFQFQSVGSKLVRDGLRQVESKGAGGCFLVGNPDYYSRFGFKSDPRLSVPWIDPPYYQWLAFGDDVPSGEVVFHQAFQDAAK